MIYCQNKVTPLQITAGWKKAKEDRVPLLSSICVSSDLKTQPNKHKVLEKDYIREKG